MMKANASTVRTSWHVVLTNPSLKPHVPRKKVLLNLAVSAEVDSHNTQTTNSQISSIPIMGVKAPVWVWNKSIINSTGKLTMVIAEVAIAKEAKAFDVNLSELWLTDKR